MLNNGYGGYIVRDVPDGAWPKHEGFFRDVIGSAQLFRKCGGTNFDENIKMAFENGESIGIDMQMRQGEGAHAITVWGAKFDSNGHVCLLYVVDNNDGGKFAENYSIERGIYTTPVKLVDGVYRLADSSRRFTQTINAAYFLGTHKAQWEAWKAKQ